MTESTPRRQRYYSVRNVMEILHISKYKVLSMIRGGHLRAYKRGGHWYIPVKEFDRQFPEDIDEIG